MTALGGEVEVPPSSDYLPLSVCIFAAIVLLRLLTFPLALVPLASYLGAPNGEKAYKTAQQMLNLVHHTTCTAGALWLLQGERWWYYNQPLSMWDGWAEGGHTYAPAVHALYMMQLGYHAHCLLFHFVEPKREDFWPMLVHHAVTAYLVYESYVSNFVRAGLLVLFAHDVSDVLGCTIKITNYLNFKYVTVGLFGPLLFLWAYTRLWLFPSNCIVASWNYGDGFRLSMGFTACFSLMFVILGLNSYWYSLFLRILVNLMRSSIKDPCTTDLSEEKHLERGKSGPVPEERVAG